MLWTELCLKEEVNKPSHTAVWEERVVILRSQLGKLSHTVVNLRTQRKTNFVLSVNIGEKKKKKRKLFPVANKPPRAACLTSSIPCFTSSDGQFGLRHCNPCTMCNSRLSITSSSLWDGLCKSHGICFLHSSNGFRAIKHFQHSCQDKPA